MKLESLNKLIDIEYFEGPMLSLFADKQGEFYIFKWLDVNPDSHSWLVFRTSIAHVLAYVAKTVSERQLVLLAPDKFFYTVNIHPDLRFTDQRQVPLETVANELISDEDIFFQKGECPAIRELSISARKESVAA